MSWILALVEQAPGGIFLQNERGEYLYANAVAAAELGCSPEVLVGRTDQDFFSSAAYAEIRAENAKVLQGGCVSFESVRMLAEGRRVTEFTKCPLRDESGAILGIVGTSRDVTRQRDELEERNRLIGELERERQLREGLVAGFGHDLRSPLTAARATAQILMRSLGPEHPGHAQALRIVRSMDRGDSMIRDLLDCSRIGAGEQLATDVVELDLVEALNETLEGLVAVHGQRFQFQCAPGPILGWWDRDAISRMLENLASNAVKYGLAQAPILVQAGISSEASAPTAWFSVHNVGAPIPAEEQAGLFDLFRRSSVRATRAKGWGIGLAIVSGLAQALRGSVALESSEATGTRFTVYLPVGGADRVQ